MESKGLLHEIIHFQFFMFAGRQVIGMVKKIGK